MLCAIGCCVKYTRKSIMRPTKNFDEPNMAFDIISNLAMATPVPIALRGLLYHTMEGPLQQRL